MKSMMTKVWRFFRRREEGAALIEYALLVALIALICIAAITLAGESISTVWEAIANALSGVA